MNRRWTAWTTGSLLLAALITGACGSGLEDDPILRLSAEEALEQGKALMEEEKYVKARRHLNHAFEIEPNSRDGREALLLAADCYYLDGGPTNFVQAEAKYRDYLNRFPTSERAAYAQYQVANSLAKRMEKPDRDQSATLEALNAYRELIRLYPTSQYAEEAQEQISVVEQNLAEHEFLVGRFNYRYDNYRGAVQRFEFLLENYPEYTEKDKVLYFLGEAYRKSRNPEDKIKALNVFARLRREYPDSEYVAKIPEREVLDALAAQVEDQQEEGR